MRMFLVLMTCSLPSATVTVTWFLLVTFPNPLTWVTWAEWITVSTSFFSFSREKTKQNMKTVKGTENWLCSVWRDERFLQSMLWLRCSFEPSSSPGSRRCLKLTTRCQHRYCQTVTIMFCIMLRWIHFDCFLKLKTQIHSVISIDNKQATPSMVIMSAITKENTANLTVLFSIKYVKLELFGWNKWNQVWN